MKRHAHERTALPVRFPVWWAFEDLLVLILDPIDVSLQ
jgi:hypothetical protein